MIKQEGLPRTLGGVVVSAKSRKTIVVLIVRKIRHPITGKYIKRSTKMLAHDDAGICREGDLVVIAESRPISRMKRWSLVEVVVKE